MVPHASLQVDLHVQKAAGRSKYYDGPTSFAK